MPKKNAIGSRPTDRSDWNDAWEIVSRLAAAREATLHEIEPDRRASPVPEATRAASNSDASADAAPADAGPADAGPVEVAQKAIEPVDQEQLAHAVAEIEKASAALRQAEPELEAGVPDAPTRKRKYWSVWILIGGVWLSATLVVAGATGAILFLFG
jgi:hypothetical protein